MFNIATTTAITDTMAALFLGTWKVWALVIGLILGMNILEYLIDLIKDARAVSRANSGLPEQEEYTTYVKGREEALKSKIKRHIFERTYEGKD